MRVDVCELLMYDPIILCQVKSTYETTVSKNLQSNESMWDPFNLNDSL